MTSLLLDTYYSDGNHAGATSNGISFNAFKAFVESQPAPQDDIIGFNNQAYQLMGSQNKVQKTEDVTIVASGRSDNDGTTIDFTLPQGVTLVMANGSIKLEQFL